MRLCSFHPTTYLIIEAIPVYGLRVTTGMREIINWIDVCICPVVGCNTARSLKAPTGKRKENRKTTQRIKQRGKRI